MFFVLQGLIYRVISLKVLKILKPLFLDAAVWGSVLLQECFYAESFKDHLLAECLLGWSCRVSAGEDLLGSPAEPRTKMGKADMTAM